MEKADEKSAIAYRAMRAWEEAEVARFIKPIFDEFIAPDYSQEGVETFYRFASPDALAKRLVSGNFVLLALHDETLAGMIEFKAPDHVVMLFVGLRRQGIARSLLHRAVERARQADPRLRNITVHSAPYAEPIYRKLGFVEVGERTTENGITALPMVLALR